MHVGLFGFTILMPLTTKRKCLPGETEGQDRQCPQLPISSKCSDDFHGILPCSFNERQTPNLEVQLKGGRQRSWCVFHKYKLSCDF